MKVYIAGPMRDLPKFNFPAFDRAEARLRAAGWEVVNPARMDREMDGFDPTQKAMAHSIEFYMRRDLPAVAGCDAIALLPGWERSDGAQKELAVAHWCGLDVLDAMTGKPLEEAA
jgi:hypothetical protein